MVVMLYVRYPLSLRNVEDLLFERGYDFCHETVRLWWNRFGPMFAAEIRRRRVSHMHGFRNWRWHLDEMYVKMNGEMVYLWRALNHEGEVLESFVTKKRDKSAETVWDSRGNRHRWPPIIPRSDVRARHPGSPGGRALVKQPGREQPPTVPATRAGDAPVSPDEIAPEVRFGSCLPAQPL